MEPCDVITCDVITYDVITYDVIPCDVIPGDVIPSDVVPCKMSSCGVNHWEARHARRDVGNQSRRLASRPWRAAEMGDTLLAAMEPSRPRCSHRERL